MIQDADSFNVVIFFYFLPVFRDAPPSPPDDWKIVHAHVVSIGGLPVKMKNEPILVQEVGFVWLQLVKNKQKWLDCFPGQNTIVFMTIEYYFSKIVVRKKKERKRENEHERPCVVLFIYTYDLS